MGALRTILRRASYVTAGGAVGTLMAYRNDLKQLQFDLASSSGPLVRLFDVETSHKIGILAAKLGFFPRETRPDPPSLRTTVWSRDFPNPLGVAAGFDKDAEVVEPLLALGFGFVEIGSVTPLPQPGNPKPRAFRLQEFGAVINRYGFNSEGLDSVATRLAALRTRQAQQGAAFPAGLLGVNLGKNKTSEDAAADYCVGVTKLGRFADYLVINISSPNTPGLRSLQGRKELETLVKQVKQTRDRMQWDARGPPPLLVKIAPDLTEEDMKDIAAVALHQKVDGLIVSNTTITRPGAIAEHPVGKEAGGLSGRPLFEMATQVLREMYTLTGGKLPIVGVGGVGSGADAYAKIRAGASLVELYSAFAYEGPKLVPRVKRELAALLERDGFASVAEAVGADHREGGKAGGKGAAGVPAAIVAAAVAIVGVGGAAWTASAINKGLEDQNDALAAFRAELLQALSASEGRQVSAQTASEGRQVSALTASGQRLMSALTASEGRLAAAQKKGTAEVVQAVQDAKAELAAGQTASEQRRVLALTPLVRPPRGSSQEEEEKGKSGSEGDS
ncbi:Dihydroorotate dehydrogenase (quinone), mitochondrial isoform A [Micractinium conductrix]|uniref:Dihydroorotate dehydrogenase (quinone), mitochondrial n=1 Tax=Micractinium conductrix TaxID=554055 RepID=A0A2P6VNQ0_9CHLO|nr:Dihydroorotate dehydrogenase (quinone), mitochondrial isoform B [Micractinium conductrix]PSC75676.1 Dihydroorotate dehydrogenase (quinone), mitochondrial isoform A [Micractinium conductrix]|eukprot:PSC75675.1 Dihydroorotate dehydrogenase (quinone), mitochondrial isoform B [Micractinium conductrix]